MNLPFTINKTTSCSRTSVVKTQAKNVLLYTNTHGSGIYGTSKCNGIRWPIKGLHLTRNNRDILQSFLFIIISFVLTKRTGPEKNTSVPQELRLRIPEPLSTFICGPVSPVLFRRQSKVSTGLPSPPSEEFTTLSKSKTLT